MKKLSQYITDQEFQCPCGCGKTQPHGIELIIPEYTDIQHILFGVYDLIRGRWDTTITSGYRCEAWNQKIGGARYSPHTFGLAIDFVVDMKVRNDVVEYLRELQKDIRLRIGHIKYYPRPGHIHIDVMPIVAFDLYTARKIPFEVFSAFSGVKEW
jgi:hypothetical protein